MNRPASDILSIDPRTISSMSVQETALYCPELQRLLQSFEAFYAKTLEINGKLFVLEGRPVFVHAIFKSAILTLTPVEKLQDTEQQVRRQLLEAPPYCRHLLSGHCGGEPCPDRLYPHSPAVCPRG